MAARGSEENVHADQNNPSIGFVTRSVRPSSSSTDREKSVSILEHLLLEAFRDLDPFGSAREEQVIFAFEPMVVERIVRSIVSNPFLHSETSSQRPHPDQIGDSISLSLVRGKRYPSLGSFGFGTVTDQNSRLGVDDDHLGTRNGRSSSRIRKRTDLITSTFRPPYRIRSLGIRFGARIRQERALESLAPSKGWRHQTAMNRRQGHLPERNGRFYYWNLDARHCEAGIEAQFPQLHFCIARDVRNRTIAGSSRKTSRS